MDDERLTEEEVAGRAGTTVARIRELAAYGILPAPDGGYARRDIVNARLVNDLADKGVDTEALAVAIANGELSLGVLQHAARRHPMSDRTFRELAEEMEVSIDTLLRMYVAFGLPRPHPDDAVRAEDLEAIRGLPFLFGAGVGEGQVLQMARVWGDSLRRVAQYLAHYLHTVIEEPFRARGLGEQAAFEAAIREVGLRSGRSGEELLGWLFRRHAELFMSEHQFEHVEAALEHAGVRQRAPRGVEACAFADLTGYTTLTEEAGDEVAADVSLRLAQLVNELAADHRGEVVKMLGDGVHFHFRDPADAVRASLDLVGAVRPLGLPPAHIGVTAGPMIYDEGDYFGRTVNLAARIASAATADRVFVGEDLVRVVEPDGFDLREIGPFELKGIAEPVLVFEAVRTPG